MNDFYWYEEVPVSEPLTQGDILLDFPVPVAESISDFPFFEVNGAEYDLVVMTQACDLENRKVENISFCALQPVEDIIKKIMIVRTGDPSLDFQNLTGKKKEMPRKILEELKKGQHLNYHLINSNVPPNNQTTIGMSHKVVYLKRTYELPVKSANNLLQHNEDGRYNKRLRLLPPYREHLAQAYANNYGRIGLPIDIDIREIGLNF